MANGSTSTNTGSYSSTDSNQKVDSNNNIQKRSDQHTPIRKTQPTNIGYVTRSKKSGLIFSVSRVENHLRKGRYAERISPKASVYLASVLEYLVAEMLELAGDMTHTTKRKRITPRDIALVIKNDDELAKLCSDVTIPEGGVQPFIHEVLLTTKRRRRTRRVHFKDDDVEDSSANRTKSTSSDIDGDVSSSSSDVDDNDVQMD